MSMNKPEPPPKPSSATACWDLVLADIAERDAMGTAKYGQRLTPGDGRDSLVDAYQEALDLTVYLRKALAERPPMWTGGSIPDEGMVLVDASALRATIKGRDLFMQHSMEADRERARLQDRIVDLVRTIDRMRDAAAMGDETIHGLAQGLGDDLARMEAVEGALARHMNIIADDAVYEGVEIRAILSELQRLLQRGPLSTRRT